MLTALCAGEKDRFKETDSIGWLPLHEAAAQRNETILELTYRGTLNYRAQIQRYQITL